MALQFQVESLDNVPEALRDSYVETEGGYRLELDGYEDPSKLKEIVSKERKLTMQHRNQLDKWQQLGKDPDEIAELLEKQQALEEDQARNAGEWDKLKEQLNSKHQSEVQSLQEQLQGMNKTLESYLVDAQAASAIAEHKGVSALLMPHVKNAVKVVNEDGQYQVRVVNERGEPRINGNGDYMSISELVAEMRGSDVYGRAFESTAKAGSGANPGGSGANRPAGVPRTWAECKTPNEKVEFLKHQKNTQGR